MIYMMPASRRVPQPSVLRLRILILFLRSRSPVSIARTTDTTHWKVLLPNRRCFFRLLDSFDSTLDVTRNALYPAEVIVSYRDKRTRDFAAGKWIKAFSGFERSARLKLDRLEAATALRDLATLPGNRFEALLGDRKGRYSIRINDQWRICFEWLERSPGPSNVKIVDYH